MLSFQFLGDLDLEISVRNKRPKARTLQSTMPFSQFPLSIYYLIFKHSSRSPKDSTVCTKYKIITARKSTWPFKHHVSCNHFVNTGKTFFSVRGIIFMYNIASKYKSKYRAKYLKINPPFKSKLQLSLNSFCFCSTLPTEHSKLH